MVKTLQAMRDRRDRTDELVAAGEVVDLRFPEGRRALSARSSKLFHLLLQNTAHAPEDERLYSVPIAWLRESGIGHLTISDFVDCIRELTSVTIEVEVRDEPGRVPHVKTGAFLAHVERDLDAERGVLLYEFSRTMRYVLERSSYWAVLDRRATLAFESRYAIRLYELMSLRAGLDRRQAETFTLEDLRARLGVPDGKLTRWVHLRQKALEPAVAEVNHISPLEVTWTPVKTGRAVTGIRFGWTSKDPERRQRAGEELGRGRLGRRTRRLEDEKTGARALPLAEGTPQEVPTKTDGAQPGPRTAEAAFAPFPPAGGGASGP
ncbi:MAG: replication initiation protein, partial [Pseudomonadota bacterium]